MASVVPQGKAIWWIIGTGVVIYMAGIGTALRFSDYRELPAAVARIDSTHIAMIDSMNLRVNAVRQSADANTASIGTVRLEIQATANSQRRILCLVEIAVLGQQLTPFELERRCPPGGGQ